MSAIRRSAVLKLASAAYEMKLDVMTGVLNHDGNGRWRINAQDLDAWLRQHEGEELVLVLGSLEDERPVETRTCHTCGRDYTEMECPYCRTNRLRLRGRA